MNKFILVGEDDKYYAGVYKRKLISDGYNVEIAENGAKVLEIAKKRKPDLILLDLIMPVMDGFTALKEIKADKTLEGVKVIVLSNLGQDEDIKMVKDLGADEYLVKSNLSISELSETIASYLK